MNNRLLRVRELLKRELGNDIQREYEFRDVLVTINDVEVARDLKSAQVFIGVIGDKNHATDVVERLNSEHGVIQNRMAKRVVLKYTPRLHFRLDDSIERGVRIVDILDNIEPAADAGADTGPDHAGGDRSENTGSDNQGRVMSSGGTEDTADSFASRLRAAGEALAGAGRIGLISHSRPDGDALGSVIALGSALSGIGCQVTLLNEDGVPDSLKFLPGSDAVATPDEFPGGIEIDILVILDTGSHERAGEKTLAAFRGDYRLVNIDHHASNSSYGDINLIDTKAPATGQIVFQLIGEMGWPLDSVARDNLFVAISTDTGSFRYPNTTATTFRIGADLLEAGADVGRLSQLLYESFPLRRLELLRELMQDMEVRNDGKVAFFKLTREAVERLGLAPTDTEGLIDLIRSIDTVVVAVFFEEMEDGKIRISARSKTPQVDVGAICTGFGGGGHQLAAGTRMKGPLDSAVEIFTQALSEKLDGRN